MSKLRFSIFIRGFVIFQEKAGYFRCGVKKNIIKQSVTRVTRMLIKKVILSRELVKLVQTLKTNEQNSKPLLKSAAET